MHYLGLLTTNEDLSCIFLSLEAAVKCDNLICAITPPPSSHHSPQLVLRVTHLKPLALWYWQFQRGHCQQWILCQENPTPGLKGLNSPLLPSVP